MLLPRRGARRRRPAGRASVEPADSARGARCRVWCCACVRTRGPPMAQPLGSAMLGRTAAHARRAADRCHRHRPRATTSSNSADPVESRPPGSSPMHCGCAATSCGPKSNAEWACVPPRPRRRRPPARATHRSAPDRDVRRCHRWQGLAPQRDPRRQPGRRALPRPPARRCVLAARWPAAHGSWSFPAAVDAATAEAAAARLEAAGVARFAAPDYPVRPMLRPSDPFFARGDQWNLQDVASTGLRRHRRRPTPGTSRRARPSMVIAVVDSGIVRIRTSPGAFFPATISSPTPPAPTTAADAMPTPPIRATGGRPDSARRR